MVAKSKSGKPRALARKRAAGAAARRSGNPEAWEQTAQIPDERYDEIDCQRIVQGEGGRSLPLYYDDYN